MDPSCKHTVLQAEDGLLHFRWYERVGTGECKGAAQHDMILFPGEATFSKVLNLAHTHSVLPLHWCSCYGQHTGSSIAETLTTLQVANAGASSRIYTLSFPQDKGRTLFFW